MMYCLVEFAGPNKSVAIAHQNWLLGKTLCYWPPFWRNNAKYTTALKLGTSPDLTTWTQYEVHILRDKFFDTFEEARSSLNLPQEALDASELSTAENETRLRRRPQPEISDSEGEEENLSPIVPTPKTKGRKPTKQRKLFDLPKPPSPPQQHSLLTSERSPNPTLVAVADVYDIKHSSPSTSTAPQPLASPYQAPFVNFGESQTMFGQYQQPPPISNESNGMLNMMQSGQPFSNMMPFSTVFNIPLSTTSNFMVPPTALAPIKSTGKPLPTDPESLMKEVIEGYTLLNTKVDTALNYLRALAGGKQAALLSSGPSIRLPLKTIGDADNLDRKVKEDENYKLALIDTLATRGGNNPNQITHRIMAGFMTDDLMTQYTFAGRIGDRKCFRDTVFMTCICDAVRKQPKGSVASDKDVEKAVEYWLKKAPKRLQKLNTTVEEVGAEDGQNEDGEIDENI